MTRLIEPADVHVDTWNAIDWTWHEQRVRHLQERIFRATRNGQPRTIKNLQKLLVRSRSAKLVAVKRVTQENRGRFTPGVDGKIYRSAKERLDLLEEICSMNPVDYPCNPVRRVPIPKPDGTLRYLGIPTIIDRVMQMVVKMALEPEHEARFEANSYGFRPGRGCHDALQQLKISIRKSPYTDASGWILDADISKCFDSIDHEAVCQRVPVFRHIVKKWLKAGTVCFDKWHQTLRGTPQGGIISPLLANIVLDGMERLFGCENSKGKYTYPKGRAGMNKGVSLIRYADDFVAMAPDKKRIVEYVIPKLREFLKQRGLSFNWAKTRIVHRNDGFDFLGFTLRQFDRPELIWLYTRPSKKSVKRLLDEIRGVLHQNRQASTNEVIVKLNSMLRGWANYFRFSNAKKIFNYVDFRVWKLVWSWCKRRHPNKGLKWIKEKYFHQVGMRTWVFGEEKGQQLLSIALFPVKSDGYVKVVRYNSPFDPDLRDYWKKRNKNKTR